MPKISVVVPVFNAEVTVRRCLDSFLSQSLIDWEMILVDDGSTDSSGMICEEYAGLDSRIRVYHKENGGVSSARQFGLETASGDYVIHADPDDWVESTMLEELYEKAESEESDMVICDFYSDCGDSSRYIKQCPSSLDPSRVLNDMFRSIHGSCCNKLVKRSCIIKYRASFPDGINYCEDVCFNVQLLIHPIKVTYLNKAYYHYVQTSKSLTNHYTIESLDSQKRFVSFLSTFFPDESFPIVTSKALVKKLAFRNAVLSKKDFGSLYPEITEVNEMENVFVWVMYKLAFTGHYHIASLLRGLYWLLHGETKDSVS